MIFFFTFSQAPILLTTLINFIRQFLGKNLPSFFLNRARDFQHMTSFLENLNYLSTESSRHISEKMTWVNINKQLENRPFY